MLKQASRGLLVAPAPARTLCLFDAAVIDIPTGVITSHSSLSCTDAGMDSVSSSVPLMGEAAARVSLDGVPGVLRLEDDGGVTFNAEQEVRASVSLTSLPPAASSLHLVPCRRRHSNKSGGGGPHAAPRAAGNPSSR